jgi:hypothetical protein
MASSLAPRFKPLRLNDNQWSKFSRSRAGLFRLVGTGLLPV